MNIRDLTLQYVEAFGKKDANVLQHLFHENFELTDPAGTFCGRESTIDYIQSIWNQFNTIEFQALNLFVDANASIIEFSLILGDKKYVGTDVIHWEGDKMLALRAYLYETTSAA